MPDVTCIGVMVADVVGKPIDSLPEKGKLAIVPRMELHLGGCAANAAISLAKLGVNTAILGKVGDDGFGDFLINQFEQHGLDATAVVRDKNEATSATMVVVHGDGERSLLHYFGANATLTLTDIDLAKVFASKFVLIAGSNLMPMFDGENAATLLKMAKEKGVTTVYDTAWDARGLWMQTTGPCLPYIDYMLPSWEEARMLAGGMDDPSDVSKYLQDAGAKIVGLKMGERGAFLRDADGSTTWVPAFDVEAVDALGAGDSFVAGFLTGLVHGWSIEECARFANAVGACCVRALGATTGILGFEATMEFLKTQSTRDEKR